MLFAAAWPVATTTTASLARVRASNGHFARVPGGGALNADAQQACPACSRTLAPPLPGSFSRPLLVDQAALQLLHEHAYKPEAALSALSQIEPPAAAEWGARDVRACRPARARTRPARSAR